MTADHGVKVEDGEKFDEYLILQESWKSCRKSKWLWYQLLLVHLEQSPSAWKKTGGIGRQWLIDLYKKSKLFSESG